MAWIESHQTLRDHPKLVRYMAELSISKASAIGHLHLLWWWVADYASDGNLSKFTEQEIAQAADFKGDAAKFCNALVTVGLLDCNAKGKKRFFSVHDWPEYRIHYDLMAEKRERQKDQIRSRVARFRQKGKERNANVTHHVTQSNAPTKPNQTNLTNQTKPTIPENLRVAWARWVKFRKEKKKPLTSETVVEQLKWLSEQPDPIACIEQSIRQGWQGLFELKESANGTRQQGTGSYIRPTITAADIDRQTRIAEEVKRSGTF